MEDWKIHISIEPTAIIDGTWTASTTSGVASFSNLRIKNGGTFTLTANCIDLNPATTIIAIEKSSYSIALSSSSLSPSVGFIVTISATLKHPDGKNYISGCDMTLVDNSSSMIGTTSGSNSAGFIGFNVYFATEGVKTLSASCPETESYLQATATLTITVLKLSLKIALFTPVTYI